MSNNSNDEAGNVGRRKFITLAGIGGVGSMTLALPGEWTKPIVDLVIVPAHAQSASTDKVYLADIFRKSKGTLDEGDDEETTGTTTTPTTTTPTTTTPTTTTTATTTATTTPTTTTTTATTTTQGT